MYNEALPNTFLGQSDMYLLAHNTNKRKL